MSSNLLSLTHSISLSKSHVDVDGDFRRSGECDVISSRLSSRNQMRRVFDPRWKENVYGQYLCDDRSRAGTQPLKEKL